MARNAPIPNRPFATAGPVWRWWAAGAVFTALLLAGALSALPPVYQVVLNDQWVGQGREVTALEATLSAELNRQADRTIILEAVGEQYTYPLTDLGMSWPAEPMADLLQQAIGALPWWERLPWRRPTIALERQAVWDLDRLERAIAPIRELIAQEPSPASMLIQDGQPMIIPEVNGRALEPLALLGALRDLGGQSRLAVPIQSVPPQTTAASLSEMGVRRLIANWSTYYEPHIPRAENVEKATQAFHGLLLKPGEILSYNATVGPITTETGWKTAPVIVSGQLVPGVGGGVCQVATTFYGAALRANLEIMERHPHQLAVPYIAPSQDAAIAQGWEDLKIRNSSLGYLYIEAEAEGGKVTFRFYGDQPANQEVRIESLVLGPVPYTVRELTDASLAPGQQVIRTHGSPGLRSEAYRVIYEDGLPVRRERLSRDQYMATDRVVLTGPATPAAEPTEPPVAEPAPDPADGGDD